MPIIKLNKSTSNAAAQTKANAAASASEQASDSTPTPAPEPTSPAQASSTSNFGKGWMKRGKDRDQALAQEDAKAASSGSTFRFFMKPGETRTITFLDGAVDESGTLDIPMFHEHFVTIGGKPQNIPCLEQMGLPCPLCETGGKEGRTSFVGLLTVIDHTPYTGSDGKQHNFSVRVFAPKRVTYRQLSVFAAKYKGLAGCTFDVTRTTDRVASVGDTFIFDSKGDVNAIMSKFGVKPVDYEKEIQPIPEETLRSWGFGTAAIGNEGGGGAAVNVKDAL